MRLGNTTQGEAKAGIGGEEGSRAEDLMLFHCYKAFPSLDLI